jgi:AcrR family transcriptional regulator
MHTRSRPDRRIFRTQNRLKEALLQLMGRRNYDEITVDEIVDLAEIGRSTFYSHFSSKEDLLFAGFDRWVLSLGEPQHAPGTETPGAQGPSATRFQFSLPMLHHIRSQKHFFQATVERSADGGVRRKTTALLAEVARRELQRMEPSSNGEARPREAQAHAVAGAFLGLVSWWLASGNGMSAEEVDRVFQEMVAR